MPSFSEGVSIVLRPHHKFLQAGTGDLYFSLEKKLSPFCMFLFVCLFVCFGDRVSLCNLDCPRTRLLGQASHKQRSTCLCLQSAVIKDVFRQGSILIDRKGVLHFLYDVWLASL